MKIAKPAKWLLIFILVVAAGVLFFAIRMYQDDIKALKAFMATYEGFDKAISDLSQSVADDSESQASEAVAGLSAKASLRLSSLIKNDAEAHGPGARDRGSCSERDREPPGLSREESKPKMPTWRSWPRNAGSLPVRGKRPTPVFRNSAERIDVGAGNERKRGEEVP